MMTLIITIIVFGILVTIHEWGHFIVAKRQGIRVEVFSVGFGPMLFKYEWHDTLYAISLIPLGGYVKMAGDEPDKEASERSDDEFFAKTPWQRMKVVMAGPLMNYILAFVLFSFVYMVGAPSPTSRVGGGLVDNMPAQRVGVLADDVITAINGREIKYWEELTASIQMSKEDVIHIDILRNELPLHFVITPEMMDPQGTGRKQKVIGIKPSEDIEMIRYGILDSLNMGGQKLLYISSMTYKSLWRMVTGQMSMKQSMTGPIGIVFITGETAKRGWIHVVHLMGLLSAALALFNFLPIPVLDGGHFVLYLLESIRKKPLSLKIQENFQKVGMFFLLGLMVFVFYNDIVNFKVVKKVKSLWTSESGVKK